MFYLQKERFASHFLLVKTCSWVRSWSADFWLIGSRRGDRRKRLQYCWWNILCNSICLTVLHSTRAMNYTPPKSPESKWLEPQNDGFQDWNLLFQGSIFKFSGSMLIGREVGIWIYERIIYIYIYHIHQLITSRNPFHLTKKKRTIAFTPN